MAVALLRTRLTSFHTLLLPLQPIRLCVLQPLRLCVIETVIGCSSNTPGLKPPSLNSLMLPRHSRDDADALAPLGTIRTCAHEPGHGVGHKGCGRRSGFQRYGPRRAEMLLNPSLMLRSLCTKAYENVKPPSIVDPNVIICPVVSGLPAMQTCRCSAYTCAASFAS